MLLEMKKYARYNWIPVILDDSLEFIKDILEKYSNIKIIGISLVLTSFFLYIIKDKIGYKDKEKITYLDSSLESSNAPSSLTE